MAFRIDNPQDQSDTPGRQLRPQVAEADEPLRDVHGLGPVLNMSQSSSSPSDSFESPSGSDSPNPSRRAEPLFMPSKLARLREKLATDGGTDSTDLALDLVLNEIVQQVRITTRATGAAIALLRGEEMVCRATTGGNAPDLGVRLDTKTGLSGACVQSRQTQLCSDTELDDRVDVAACRALGVRSILVLPLLTGTRMMGVFEVFSPLHHAFGERDVQTLQAFIQQILGAVEEAESLSRGGEQATQPSETPVQRLEPDLPSLTPALYPLDADGGPVASRRDWITPILTGVVIALAILLGTLIGMHISRNRNVPRRVAKVASPAEIASMHPSMAQQGVPPQSTSAPQPESSRPVETGAAQNENRQKPQKGGLVVYKNDRVVFQIPPTAAGSTVASNSADAPDRTQGTTGQADPLANLPEVSADAANRLLVKQIQPAYPPDLAGQSQQPVHIRIAVDRSGTVQAARYESGPAELAPAALDAVKKWRFTPYSVNGVPAAFQTVVSLPFAAH